VQTKSVPKSLRQRLIIKNIAQMNVAVLLQTVELWKSIMRRKQLGMALFVHVKNVDAN
jgi:hypothetical protein